MGKLIKFITSAIAARKLGPDEPLPDQGSKWSDRIIDEPPAPMTIRPESILDFNRKEAIEGRVQGNLLKIMAKKR